MAKIITRIDGRKIIAGSTKELVEKLRGYTPEIDFGEFLPMYDDDEYPCAVTAAVTEQPDSLPWEVQ